MSRNHRTSRRMFVGSTLLALPAFPAALSAQPSLDQQLEVSPADSLQVYVNLLPRVQSELLSLDSANRPAVQTDIASVRATFMSAATAVAQQQNEEARKGLATARQTLESARARYAPKADSLPRWEAMVQLIDGVTAWIKKGPQPRTAQQRKSLWDLLNNYSPAATLLREVYLRALVTPIWVGYSDPKTRERLIAEVLTVFPSTPPVSTTGQNFTDFVSALAMFVK